MAVEFAVIRNPNNLVFKYEVWIKGESVSTDKLGQPMERLNFCQKTRSFLTAKGAQGFVDYQTSTREFRGVFV